MAKEELDYFNQIWRSKSDGIDRWCCEWQISGSGRLISVISIISAQRSRSQFRLAGIRESRQHSQIRLGKRKAKARPANRAKQASKSRAEKAD